jgi:acyl dehydratase
MIFQEGQTYEKEFCVSSEVYNGFIDVFHDQNSLHTDTVFAKNKGFQSVVMHGNILNGFLSYFIGECLPTKDVIIHTQEIQFKNAVYLNDTLDFKTQVVGVYESVNAIEFKFEFRKKLIEINEVEIDYSQQVASVKKPLLVAKGKIQIGILL